jgi:hypothetical protein
VQDPGFVCVEVEFDGPRGVPIDHEGIVLTAKEEAVTKLRKNEE